jgi:hypothetical protein
MDHQVIDFIFLTGPCMQARFTYTSSLWGGQEEDGGDEGGDLEEAAGRHG